MTDSIINELMKDDHQRVLDCMRTTGLDEGRINDASAATNLAFEFLRSRRPDEPVALLVAACAGTLAHLLADPQIAPVYARIVNGILTATPWRLVDSR